MCLIVNIKHHYMWVLPNFFFLWFIDCWQKFYVIYPSARKLKGGGTGVKVSSVCRHNLCFFVSMPVTVLYGNEVTVTLTLNIKVREVFLSVTYLDLKYLCWCFVCWDEYRGGLSFFSWKVDNFTLPQFKFVSNTTFCFI